MYLEDDDILNKILFLKSTLLKGHLLAVSLDYLRKEAQYNLEQWSFY